MNQLHVQKKEKARNECTYDEAKKLVPASKRINSSPEALFDREGPKNFTLSHPVDIATNVGLWHS
jgi:hypothetical protein